MKAFASPVSFLLIICMSAGLCCSCAAAPDPETPAAPSAGTEEEGEADRQIVHLDDVLDTFAWIGYSPEELGLSQFVYDDLYVAFEGRLFGRKADGRAHLLRDLDRGEKLVHNICIYDSEGGFMDTARCLQDLYGDPYAEGEEPYVESKGGTVAWMNFYTGDGNVSIQKAMNYSYYSLEYVQGPPPEAYEARLHPSLEDIANSTGYHLVLGEDEFQSLTLVREGGRRKVLNMPGTVPTPAKTEEEGPDREHYRIRFTWTPDGHTYEIVICPERDVLPEGILPEALAALEPVTPVLPTSADPSAAVTMPVDEAMEEQLLEWAAGLCGDMQMYLSEDGAGALVWRQFGGVWAVLMEDDASGEALVRMLRRMLLAWNS